MSGSQLAVGNPLVSSDLRTEIGRRTIFEYVLTPLKLIYDTRKIALAQVNPHLLLDSLVQCQVSLSRYSGPFKLAGHLAYWITKIKPFRMTEPGRLFTNERAALIIGCAIVSESFGQKPIHYSIFENLLYDLRYGNVSPMALSNQLQMLYADEYAKANP